ncbi:protein mono-ADP-ribosyltransferase PARP12 isoform X2 [Corythoichthys intestinalis]|uniref:protein mono-ADP-ribosyltransferase PARP12 isoform X2 n=1 Tax=Corythoichthys intestinalis TaxID=161448 RepID=UPI0025A66AD4|nr:protein mono-ADP-ribosyltransferase PARP12 isoform X2 [Corythoichthys intestinalis]
MSVKVSNLIIQILCEEQGSLAFKKLLEKLEQKFTVAESVLQNVLVDEDRIALQKGVLALQPGEVLSQDTVVVAKTSLRICQKKPGECTQCDSLHLCKFYVLGTCVFGIKCKQPHSFAHPHNTELLKRFDLIHLSEKQLFQLLLQNDPYLLPDICSHYNLGDGASGLCEFSSRCHKLHVCKPYLTTGKCKQDNSSCSRIHNIDGMSHKSFERLSLGMIMRLAKIYKNKCIITDRRPAAAADARNSAGLKGAAKPVSDSDKLEICLFSLTTSCAYKEKCVRVHWQLPYRWQVLESSGSWKDLNGMEAIEKAYCNPGKESNKEDQELSTGFLARLKNSYTVGPQTAGIQTVDFIGMTCNGSPVRRLSTASSVTKPPHFILTTQWLWYWKDDDCKWHEYGQDFLNTLNSEELEKTYMADQKAQTSFSAGTQQYVIHFSPAGTRPMYQQNIKYLTWREVRRRPRFVSSSDVKALLKNSKSSADEVPPHWNKSMLPDIGYKLVQIPQSPEYNSIESLFKATMPQSKIQSIKRIQNPSLWTRYNLKRKELKTRNSGIPALEQYLFHGTNENITQTICEQNFDWRVNGVHGTAYGKGSYFAKQASYSNRYVTATGAIKSMFVALVLIGEYTKGHSSYCRPPAKPLTTTLYDSCVDNEAAPNIFVIFDSHQIYPEYIIYYSG